MHEEEEGTKYKITKPVSSIWSDHVHIFNQIFPRWPCSFLREKQYCFTHSVYHLQHFSTTDEPHTPVFTQFRRRLMIPVTDNEQHWWRKSNLRSCFSLWPSRSEYVWYIWIILLRLSAHCISINLQQVINSEPQFMNLISSITAYLKLQPDDSRTLGLIWRENLSAWLIWMRTLELKGLQPHWGPSLGYGRQGRETCSPNCPAVEGKNNPRRGRRQFAAWWWGMSVFIRINTEVTVAGVRNELMGEYAANWTFKYPNWFEV